MVLKAQSTNRRNKTNSNEEFLYACDTDDEGFTEGNINTGKVLASFNFGLNAAPNENKAPAFQAAAQTKTNGILSTQTQTYSSAPRGLTPPINGENFTVKRSYAMRPSTVRKLNAIKAEHPDVNVLFNTIVDIAISHYYNYTFNEKGIFGIQE